MFSSSEFVSKADQSKGIFKSINGYVLKETCDNIVSDIIDEVFFSDGMKIAICTSHDAQSKSQVRMLEKHANDMWILMQDREEVQSIEMHGQ